MARPTDSEDDPTDEDPDGVDSDRAGSTGPGDESGDGDIDRDVSSLATLAGGGGVILSGRVLKVFLLFGVQVLIARILGTSAYGGVVLATMIVSVGAIVGKLGLDSGLVRNIPQYEDDPARARGVFLAGYRLAVVGGVSVGVAVFLAAPTLATSVFSDPALAPLFRIAAVAVPFSVLVDVGLSAAKATRDARPEVVVNHLLSPVVKAVAVAALVLAGYGAVGAMAGKLVTMVVAAAAAAVLAVRAGAFSVRGRTVRMDREMLTFSLPLMLSSGVSFLISNTDTFFIGLFLTSGAVGVYGAAFRLRMLGLFFFHPFTFLLAPVVSRLSATGERAAMATMYRVVSKWTVLLTTPLFLVTVLFPRVVIGLTFGPAYIDGATALRLLSVPVMVTVLLGANGKALMALGHNRVNLYVNLGTATVNVALNALLIPRFGIAGAAAASATAFVGRDVAFSVALYRWEGLHPFSRAMLQPFAGSLAVAAAGYLAVSAVGVSVASIAVAGVAFGLIYAPLVVWLGGLEPADERLLTLFEQRFGVRLSPVRRAVRRIGVADLDS